MTSDERPLNRTLHDRLKRVFGEVRIHCPGQGAVFSVRRRRGGADEDYGWTTESELVEPGEYYRVNCPFCRDRRFRLWINHTWGRRNEEGDLRRQYWAAVCYNENCLSRGDNARELIDVLTSHSPFGIRQFEEAELEPAWAEVDYELRWPGKTQRLADLPAGHKARTYLAGRGFDPVALSNDYALCYCDESNYWLARNRIVIPYYEAGELRGWQARMTEDPPKHDPQAPLKVWTGPGTKRSQLLYGYQRARRYATVFLVEGPADAWACGFRGIAAWGQITSSQCRKVVSVARESVLVAMPDPDIREKPDVLRTFEKRVASLRREHSRPVFVVWLPDGTDPGQFGGDFLWEYASRSVMDGSGERLDPGLLAAKPRKSSAARPRKAGSGH